MKRMKSAMKKMMRMKSVLKNEMKRMKIMMKMMKKNKNSHDKGNSTEEYTEECKENN